MSDFANTLHRPAILGGFFDCRARLLNSSMVSRNRSACWSRKEPVPAAQTEFIEKSFIARPSSPRTISLESSPPISMIAETSSGIEPLRQIDTAHFRTQHGRAPTNVDHGTNFEPSSLTGSLRINSPCAVSANAAKPRTIMTSPGLNVPAV